MLLVQLQKSRQIATKSRKLRKLNAFKKVRTTAGAQHYGQTTETNLDVDHKILDVAANRREFCGGHKSIWLWLTSLCDICFFDIRSQWREVTRYTMIIKKIIAALKQTCYYCRFCCTKITRVVWSWLPLIFGFCYRQQIILHFRSRPLFQRVSNEEG